MSIHVPPIKIQGIKTKLVDTIKAIVSMDRNGIWYEPFMGSGVVGLNILPEKARFSDTNPYTIQLYNDIKTSQVTSCIVREFLEKEGSKLAACGNDYYKQVRERFNKKHNSLDFLFLNRCCFNGLIRFNRNGYFNVPFGHKPQRFSKAYITKIVNQIKYLEEQIKSHDWEFCCCPFDETIKLATEYDYIYTVTLHISEEILITTVTGTNLRSCNYTIVCSKRKQNICCLHGKAHNIGVTRI